jgi:hypothetical protein
VGKNKSLCSITIRLSITAVGKKQKPLLDNNSSFHQGSREENRNLLDNVSPFHHGSGEKTKARTTIIRVPLWQ